MTEPPSDAGALFVAVDVHYLHDSVARAAAVTAGERSFSRVTRTRTAMVRAGAPYKPGECRPLKSSWLTGDAVFTLMPTTFPWRFSSMTSTSALSFVEVYPPTGSGTWVRDVIGIVAGVLMLTGLLARGLFVVRRRRRAARADDLGQEMMPPERKRGLRRAAPRSRAGKLALLAVSIGVMGYVCARLIALLAEVRPYTGWYWLLAVASGIGVAVALPWAFARGARGTARWPGWLLLGYTMVIVGGMRYYLSLRFTPPGNVPAVLPPPPPWFVLQIAGLSAVTLTLVAITLLIVAVMAEVIAPGLVGGWLRAQRTRRATRLAPAPRGQVGQQFPGSDDERSGGELASAHADISRN